MGKEKYQIISDSSCDLTLEMAEQLNQFLNKAFDFEEQGYVEEAIQLCEKCIQVFPEYENDIKLEIAKMIYRNGEKVHERKITNVTINRAESDGEEPGNQRKRRPAQGGAD